MSAKPNVGGMGRFITAVVGFGFIAWGLYGYDERLWRIVLPAIGAYILIEGVIGFSILLWVFGRRGEN